jgi:hypothetical protein
MLALFVMLTGVFAVQAKAADPFKTSFCDQPSCGCPTSSEGGTLITYYCACSGGRAERSCVYG